MTARRTQARYIGPLSAATTAARHEGFPTDEACRHRMRSGVSVPGDILRVGLVGDRPPFVVVDGDDSSGFSLD